MDLRRHPVHQPALLVHADEEGDLFAVEGLEAVGEGRELFRALDVPPEEDESAHLIVLEEDGGVAAGLGALEARHQELPHLLLGGHGIQPGLNGVRGGCGFRCGRDRGRGCGHGGGGGPGTAAGSGPGAAPGGRDEYT